LVGVLALSLGAAPIGVFLMLRRMSLAGDAMAHAVLPGAAIGYLIAGLSLSAMTLGGLVAGLLVALLAGGVARHSVLKEDVSLAAFYLLSISSGVMLIALRGNNLDLLHVLFGSVLALDDASLVLLASFASLTLLLLALGLRVLVLECCDPVFLRGASRLSAPTHYLFMALVVINLVGGFHALGTLMAVGVMILPAAISRMWVASIGALLGLAVAVAFAFSVGGLLVSFNFNLPAGPAIVLSLGLAYLVSLLIAPYGPLMSHLRPRWHFKR
jgi:zinc/manganese transport system permease protein